jgi:hypothetical protein
MAISFPSNPNVNDTFTVDDKTFLWTGDYWRTLSSAVTFPGIIKDADNDTKVEVEQSVDEDTIRFSVAGTEKASLDASGLTVTGDISVTGSYVGLSSDSITDADGDTKIQVEESADEDTIRFDTAGIERMTIGSTGLVSIPGDLTVNGTLTSSIDTGPVIQMVVATTTTQTLTTSTTYVDTTLSASITPTSASSDIYVLLTGHVRPRRTSATNSGWGYMNIVRDSTQIAETASRIDVPGTGTVQQQSPAAVSILDSPATTSAITYKVQIKSSSPAETVFSGQSFTSTITLIEVAS